MTDALVLVWSGTNFTSSATATTGVNYHIRGTNMTVDWGDGTTGTITSGQRFTHTYSSNGTYVITITGDSILRIERYCFHKCTGLKKIIIPPSVTNLSYSCFENCTQLESIIFTRSTPPGMASQACYYNVPTTCKIYVPNSSYKSASYYPSSSTYTYIINTVGELCDRIHPIGSIYQTTSSTHPSLLFGGAWKQIKDKFLLASGSTYTNGSTGGESTHVLTGNEMPGHNHWRYTAPWTVAERDLSKCDIICLMGEDAYKVTKYSNSTGGRAAHNNMPPYLAVYIWERIG